MTRYSFKSSTDRIGEIYKNAIYKANIKGAKLKKYINIILKDYIINGSNIVKYDTSINGVIQLLKDLTIGNNPAHITISSLLPQPDIGILMMNHAINRVKIKNELRRIKKRSLGLGKSKIQTKRRKIVNKVKQVKTDLEVVGESISK